MVVVGQEFLILPPENEVLRATCTSDRHPSPIGGGNDYPTSESTVTCSPTSHTLAEEAGLSGQVWYHMVLPAVVPAEWINNNKTNNLWPMDRPEESLSGFEIGNTKRGCLIWGSHNRPKPRASFGSVGTEKKIYVFKKQL